jgi:hypothetical protein
LVVTTILAPPKGVPEFRSITVPLTGVKSEEQANSSCVAAAISSLVSSCEKEKDDKNKNMKKVGLI